MASMHILTDMHVHVDACVPTYTGKYTHTYKHACNTHTHKRKRKKKRTLVLMVSGE